MVTRTMRGRKVAGFVKDLIKKGQVSRLKVLSEDRQTCYLNIPIGIVLISSLFSPLVSGLCFTLIFVKKCKVEITPPKSQK